MKEIEVEGRISSLLEKLFEIFQSKRELWFRGQSNYEHNLVPHIFRQGDDFKGVIYDEAEMYREFIRRYPEQSVNYKSVYEWLTLMQHYGLPTRLLDWTTNLLVALYFCCEKEQEQDGAVFVFDPNSMRKIRQDKKLEQEKFLEVEVVSRSISEFYINLISEASVLYGNNAEVFINDYSIREISSDLVVKDEFTNVDTYMPFKRFRVSYNGEKEKRSLSRELLGEFTSLIPFKAPHLNSRIKAQHGLFSIHGGKYFDGKKFISSTMADGILDTGTIKIKIKGLDKSSIMRELELSGIRKAILFPEMEYQAEEISNIYSKLLRRDI